MTKKVWAVLLAFLYSFFYTVVGPKIKTQDLSFDGSEVLPFVLCFLICSVINILIVFVVQRWDFEIKRERVIRSINRIGERKLFFLIWGCIFVSWLPAYFVCFPGILSYDIINQTRDALGTIVDNHHPVLHTWLLRVFMQFGERFFSSYEVGLGLLSLIQMLLVSYALSRLVILLKKKNVPILIVILTALFSAVWFMNACLSVTMIKDTLFAAFFVLFVCHFTEIVINPDEYLRNKKNLFLLSVVGFLMCATRNNGFHIYLFCFAGLLLLRIKHIKKAKIYFALIVAIILPIFAYKIYTGPIFDAWNIKPGEVREALSVPIQQLQRVAYHRSELLTEEQTELMDYYIDNLEWMEPPVGRAYDPFIADPAKGCFSSAAYNEDPIAFWKFYLEIGRQFAKDYVVAFLSNTLGYWYPGQDDFTRVEYENYPVEWFPVPLERKSLVNLQFVENYYESVCTSETWRTTPVVRLFFVPGYAPWILIFAMILSWKKKENLSKVVPLFLPLIAQLGIMILSPMASFRYSWPFFLVLPICFVGIWGKHELKTTQE